MNKIVFSFVLIFSIPVFHFGQTLFDPIEYRNALRSAYSLYRSGNYAESLIKFEEAFSIQEGQRIDLYNAACSASLTGKIEKSFEYLTKSIDNGYIDQDWMINDKDFANLKNSKYWKKAIKKIKSKIKSIESDFKKIIEKDLKELIPYHENKQWGYLDKESLEIVVDAKYKSVSFGGTCLKVELTDKNFVIIDGQGKIKAFRQDRSGFPPNLPPPPPLYPRYPEVDSTERFIGFRISEKGKITYVSHVYDDTEWVWISADVDNEKYRPKIEIFGPYMLNGRWHAIVQKNNKWGIIDEKGNILDSVGFKYNELFYIDKYIGEESWFYFEDINNMHGFVNAKGEILLFDEFVNRPNTLNNNFGFVLLQKDALNGIFNLNNMEWVIEPIPERLVGVYYTHNKNCTDQIKNVSEIAEIYILIYGKNGEKYYIDSDLKKYIPR